MKVVWTHIAKNGGHFIKEIAKQEYGSCYLVVKNTTSIGELDYFLSKERFFIAVNHHEARIEVLKRLMEVDAHRILITRNPVDRFSSFIRHATVLKGPFLTEAGTRLWNQEASINYPLNASHWLSACLERIRMELSCSHEMPIIDNPSLTYFALSQLWEAFFKMNYIISENKLIYSKNPVNHLVNLRKCAIKNNQSIAQYVEYFIEKYYSCAGSVSRFDLIMEDLHQKNVFSRTYSHLSVKEINSFSAKFAINLDSQIVASYYGILQEEFLLNSLCTPDLLDY